MAKTSEPDLKYVPTTCPHCGVGCGLNLVVNEGKVVGVEPNKRTPINEGKLCPKGMTCWEHVHSPDRLTKPKIKKGGKFVDASWDEAIDLVVEKLSEHKGDAFAGISSARCTNEDNYVFQKLVRGVMGTNNIDHCARL